MQTLLKKTEKLTDRVFDFILVFVLVVGLYYAYDAFIVFKGAEAGSVKAYRPTAEDPSAYSKISDECVAWLTIYDGDIDYPIMQGNDNSKYINTDPFGAYSLSGAIFLDSRNDSHFKDDYSLIYGHHLEGKQLFGALDAYEENDYFEEHRKGELVVDGKFHDIETFAFTHTDASEGLLFDPERPGSRLEWIEKNADIFKKPTGERIVALSTCTTPTSTKRTILFVSILD